MPGKLRQRPTSDSINLQEEHVGTATSAICFPRIQSCLAITALSAHGISGFHLTYATEVNIIDDAMKIIAPTNPTKVFIVGGVAFFKQSTGVSAFKTRKSMKSKMKQYFPSVSNIYFYDTWVHSNDVNLAATLKNNSIDFAWEPGRVVSWDTTPDLSSYAPIPGQLLVQR